MKSKELKQWLRDNSSGCYRPSAQAADYIQELEECLSEAVDLMEDVRIGAYKPDSVTTQPWKRALSENGEHERWRDSDIAHCDWLVLRLSYGCDV